jgi:hypothetical protein
LSPIDGLRQPFTENERDSRERAISIVLACYLKVMGGDPGR